MNTTKGRTIILRIFGKVSRGKLDVFTVSGDDIPAELPGSIKLIPPHSLPREEDIEISVVMIEESERWRSVPMRWRKRGGKVWRLFK